MNDWSQLMLHLSRYDGLRAVCAIVGKGEEKYKQNVRDKEFPDVYERSRSSRLFALQVELTRVRLISGPRTRPPPTMAFHAAGTKRKTLELWRTVVSGSRPPRLREGMISRLWCLYQASEAVGFFVYYLSFTADNMYG